jgi:hypothetical protein
MVANVVVVTEVVVIVKDALLALAGTVMVAGICAAALLSERLTTKPPLGAGPVKVTVPVDELPPTTLVGFRLNTESPGGVTVKLVVCVMALRVAESVAVTVLAVELVVTLNLALVAFACTVTDAGTWAVVLLEDSVTTAPPVGAGLFKVTVATAVLPPATLVGLTTSDDGTGGVDVTVSCTAC